MKFLIDRCAGRALTAWLNEQGHDALHVAELGPDPGDESLLGQAVAMQRILVTIDTDFGTLVFRDAAVHRGVVRLPDVPSASRIEIMRQLLAKHARDMETGAVITVRGSRVRITPPASENPGATDHR